MLLTRGTKLGAYEILSPIGKGGMGEVYRARDTKLDRDVAVKVLRPELASDPERLKRFEQEARSASALNHPNIIHIYDIGDHEGTRYIAMELVEGRTLRDVLREAPLPTEKLLPLAAQIAEGLAKAHSAGIVHRDLKPDNLMVTEDGYVKILDFGLAKLLPEPAQVDSEMATRSRFETLPGVVVGTVQYMSPEQAIGRRVDYHSDQFSFGSILYEMTTGKLAFRKESAPQTMTAILEGEPEPIKKLNPKAPAHLDKIVGRCLKKDPGERYDSTVDLARELKSYQSGPIPVDRRNLLWAAVGIVTVFVAFALAPNLGRFLGPRKPALAFAERDWILIADTENLTGDPIFDRSLSMALNVGISQSQYVNVFPRSRLQEVLKRMNRTTAEKLDEGLASEVAVREGIRGVLSCSIVRIGNMYELTARLIDPQSRLPVLAESERAEGKEEVLPALDRLATRIRRNLGESLGALSHQHVKLPQATTASLEALKLYADARQATDDTTKERLLQQAVQLDPDFALAHAQLGMAYYMESDRETRLRGEEHFAKALGLLDRLTFKERLWISARAEDSRGNRDQAVAAYKAYLTAYPDDMEGWFRLGWTYMATLNEFEAGIEAFQRAIEIDPGNSASLVNLATCYTGLYRDQEAREAYERAFALNPGAMMGFFVNHEYGFTLVRLGDLGTAAEVFRKMTDEADAAKRAHGHRSTALLEMYQGRYAAAVEALHQAILINEANGFQVSEYRDRLFLASALRAGGQRRALEAEMNRVEHLMSRTSLSPWWIRLGVKLLARNGRIRQAKELLEVMAESAGDPTSGSGANRNTQDDAAHLNVAQGEIELSSGRATEALRLFEAAYQLDSSSDTLESLAAACFGAGRLDDAARHYEKLIADRDLGGESQELWFLAHLRLAEIHERLGRPDAARTLYEQLLSIWKDADPDLPALREAQEGLARLS